MTTDEDTLFVMDFTCPRCGHEWEDTWDAIVTNDCPECKLRDIEPVEVSDAPD